MGKQSLIKMDSQSVCLSHVLFSETTAPIGMEFGEKHSDMW